MAELPRASDAPASAASGLAPAALPQMSGVALDQGTAFPLVAPLADGRRIGAYQIMSVLGHGGMGVVYQARQNNPLRIVALKVIHADRSTRGQERRFLQETQVLGRLQHPGIAQIYEAGTADPGTGLQPYFAMELIAGPSLTDYARQHALPIPARLELFRRVCAAVQYAHEQGVIHRDLKPANILVDQAGQPKILDFGVARVVAATPEQLTQHTEAGALIGTLSYMSPEQAGGDGRQVDARADVYALGVILYELLTGRLPYPLKNRALPEAVRIIREDDPTRLTSINRVLGGDVETIVTKALEKSPERRYASAAQLADDIRRFLANEPIRARAPSTLYQWQKFARRNRALVAGVGAVFLALVLGLIGTTWQAQRARQQSVRADANAQRADGQARAAQLRLAEGLVSQGDALVLAGRIADAREPYLQAWDLFSHLGVSSLPAELGLWAVEQRHPTPLCLIKMSPSNSSWCQVHFVTDSTLAYSQGHTLRFCDLRTGQIGGTLEGHTGDIRDFALANNGQILVSIGDDHAIKTWDVPRLRCLRTIIDPDLELENVAVSAQDTMCLAGVAGQVKRWKLETGELLQSFPAAKPAQFLLAASPTGHTALTRSSTNLLQLWDTVTGHAIHVLAGSIGTVNGAAYLPDPLQALTYANDETLRLWNLADGTQQRAFPQPGRVECLAICPQGNRFACGVGDPLRNNSMVRLCDATSGTLLQEFNAQAVHIQSLGFSRDGRILAAAGADHLLQVWPVAQPLTTHTLHGHVGSVPCAAASADGRILVSGGADKIINVWDMASRQLLRTLGGHTNQVTSIALSADGLIAASASADGSVRQWDLVSGKEIRAYRGRPDSIGDVVLSPDGQVIFFIEESARIYRWDTSGGAPPPAVIGRQEGTSHLCLSPDASHLFFSFSGGIAAFDDPLRQATRRVLTTNRADLTSTLAIAPDGHILATGEPDGTIRLWQANSGTPRGTLHGHTGDISALAFRRDGTLVSMGNDQTLRLWDSGELREIRLLPATAGSNCSLPVCPDGTVVSPRMDDSGSLDVWDFSAVQYLRQQQAPVREAYETLAQHPAAGAALATLGAWYAFRRMPDWAVFLLEEARRQGTPVSALTLARCYWQLGDAVHALAEFARASAAHEAPEPYLRLCRMAVAQPPAPAATSPALHAGQ